MTHNAKAGDLLEQFSDIQLLEELARRVKLREEENEPENWCDNCRHFKYPKTENGNVRCVKKHKMKFWMPKGYTDDFGYYVDFCPDREA